MAAGQQLVVLYEAWIALLTEAMQHIKAEQSELLGPINIKSADDPSMQALQGAHEWIGFLQFFFG